MDFNDAMVLLVFLAIGAWVWLLCYLTLRPLDKPLFRERRGSDYGKR